MKVVHTKDKVSLLMRLKEEADTETLKIESAPHQEYVLKKYMRLWIWDTIAHIDPYLRTIVVREAIWKEHEDLIKRLATIIEDNTLVESMTIEVRP